MHGRRFPLKSDRRPAVRRYVLLWWRWVFADLQGIRRVQFRAGRHGVLCADDRGLQEKFGFSIWVAIPVTMVVMVALGFVTERERRARHW